MAHIDLPYEQLKGYLGSSPRPDDFDLFWERALDELDRHEHDHGFNPVCTDAETPVSSATCYDLYFTSIDHARIHARVALPATLDNRTVPALLKFHGYTMNAGSWSRLLPYTAEGYTIAAMDVRGQGGDSTDPGTGAQREPDDPYAGPAGPTVRGHIIRGVENGPESLFYRSVYLDTVALSRIVAGWRRVDESRIGCFGASQGGALALACAALSPFIQHTVSIYPFLSDFRRSLEMETGGSAYEEIRHYLKRRDPRHERIDRLFRTLSYIDVQFLAERIAGSVRMISGLQDEACLPSTQFAAYNRLTAQKDLIVYPDFGHDDLPESDDLTLAYFNERFSP